MGMTSCNSNYSTYPFEGKRLNSSNHSIAKKTKLIQSSNKENGLPTAKKRKPIRSSNEENGLLMIFKIMKEARKLHKEAFEVTKKDTRKTEEQWEKIANAIAGSHGKSASKQTWMSPLYALPLIIEGLGIPIAPWVASKDQEQGWWKNLESKAPAQFLANITQHIAAASNKEEVTRGYIKNVSNFASQIVQGFSGNIQMELQQKITPEQMQSQAAQALHQSKSSDESNHKQQLIEMERILQDLMRQEASIFQGASGRA